MSNLNELELDSITNAKGIRIPFVIVFTHTDEYLSMFAKKQKVWKDFEKKYKSDRPKDDYFIIEDIKLDDSDDDEPYKKKNVAMITKESLSAISENDKAAMTFGIRVVDEENKVAHVFTDDMLDYFSDGGLTGYVNQDIEFDNVESTLYEVMEQTKQLNHAAKLKASNEESKNADNVDESPQEDTANTEKLNEESTDVDNMEDKNVDSEVPTEKKKVKNESEKASATANNEPSQPKPSRKTRFDNDEDDVGAEQNPTPIAEIPSNTPEENHEILAQNKSHEMVLSDKEPETPLEFAQQDLMYEISKMIPRIDIPVDNYIPDDMLDTMVDTDSYEEFKSIKRLTEDKLNKRAQYKETYLNGIRNEAISEIFNNLNRRLNVENDELMRKSDFTSDYSPFNTSYQKLNKEYQTIINSLSDTKHSQVERNKQKHERDKRAYVDRAAKEAGERFDNENLHLIEDNAQAYVDDIKSQADTQYNDSYEVLKKDSDNWYVQNFNTLIPKIIQAGKDDIENIAQNINSKMSEGINELNQKAEADLDYFADKIKEIVEKQIETNKNNEALIKSRVHERTLEYPDMKNEIQNQTEEIERLKKDLAKKHEESEENRKQYVSERKQNEALEESLANRNMDMNAARDDYHHLARLISEGKVEQLQKILDKDKVEPVKESILDKLKNYTSVLAASIISAAMIIAALLFGAGQDKQDEGVSQSEVKSEVQQAVKDKEKESAKKDAEIDKLKSDLKEEQDKSKDSKKDK